LCRVVGSRQAGCLRERMREQHYDVVQVRIDTTHCCLPAALEMTSTAVSADNKNREQNTIVTCAHNFNSANGSKYNKMQRATFLSNRNRVGLVTNRHNALPIIAEL